VAEAEREPVVTISGLIIPPGTVDSDAPKDIPLKVDENRRLVVDVEAAEAAGWKLDHTGWYRHG
jgi:hypothetical protein